MRHHPTAIDPLLGLIAPRALASPLTAAMAYGVLASGTSIFAAALEGRLINATDVYWGAQHLMVHPFISNVSTILDFAILNPVVIFFLLRSRWFMLGEPALSRPIRSADRYLYRVASAASLVLAIILMLAYAQSFVYGKFYDAVVAISDQGKCFITITGWVVFFWTGLFSYILIIGALNQVSYVVRICRLKPADVSYDPLHEDEAAGLRVLAMPAVEFTKASLVLLLIGFVFWVYDRLTTSAALTDRTSSITIFIAIVFPLFAIPIAQLHYLMCDLRERILRSVLGGEPRGLRHIDFSSESRGHDLETLQHLKEEIEAAEKVRSCVLSFPT